MEGDSVFEKLKQASKVCRTDFELEGAPPPWDPVVSESYLFETENALGFRLPDMLRRVLTEVSNGGFGPGFGLMGANDPQYNESADDRYILAHYRRETGWDLSELGWTWPRAMISLVDLGCGIRWCLDCENDQLVYFAGDTIDYENRESFERAFIRTGVSFIEAVDLWLKRTSWDTLLE